MKMQLQRDRRDEASVDLRRTPAPARPGVVALIAAISGVFVGLNGFVQFLKVLFELAHGG